MLSACLFVDERSGGMAVFDGSSSVVSWVWCLVCALACGCDTVGDSEGMGAAGTANGGGGTGGDALDGGVESDASMSDCLGAGSSVDLECAAPPDTFSSPVPDGGVGSGLARQWDTWAWNSFVAYNWPALASDDSSAYPSGFVRGVPDTARAFADATPSDVLVWETFKEKREVFNTGSTSGAWQALTYEPKYAPDFLGGTVPACAGIDNDRLQRVMARPRVVAQIAKQAPASGFDDLDETAEVASPAQESQDTLCAGYAGDAGAQCRMFHAPPPGGSATTQYTATEGNFRAPVGPRVFKGRPNSEHFVYYEVKVNWDYYNYVSTKGYNDYDTATSAARADAGTEITLPARTSADALGMGNQQNGVPVCKYSAAETHRCYASQLAGCGVVDGCAPAPDYTPDASKLPAVGSVQLKAAWVPSGLLDGDLTDYHLTEAVYYRDSPAAPEGLCYAVEEFGLVGLHIIQRVHAGDPAAPRAQPLGGTFIFATWEHESIADGRGYSYVNYEYSGGQEQSTNTPYPNTDAGIVVERLQNYPLPGTAQVNAEVHTDLPTGSLWTHYRLIGTQFVPTSTESKSSAIDQPHYLADLVIETNRGLQQFQGLPPNVTPISKYAGTIGNTSGQGASFAPTEHNLQFQSAGYTMGGCMGCHGVAQANGFAFSFVLQDGSKGTKPDTAGSIAIPPVAPPL
jgi:hypothetical protein